MVNNNKVRMKVRVKLYMRLGSVKNQKQGYLEDKEKVKVIKKDGIYKVKINNTGKNQYHGQRTRML